MFAARDPREIARDKSKSTVNDVKLIISAGFPSQVVDDPVDTCFGATTRRFRPPRKEGHVSISGVLGEMTISNGP